MHAVKKLVLLLPLLLMAAVPVFSQGKLEASFGLVTSEGLCIKLKYGNNLQAGLSQGFYSGTAMLTGIEGYWHFAGRQQVGTQKPFYLMAGLGTTIFSKGFSVFEKTLFYPRIGRTVNFTERLGMNLDIGPDFLRTNDDGVSSSVFPAGSIHFFFRF